jgi:hypothetical protein
MATITVTKGQIGVQDITFMSGGATTGETFSRATSTGGSQNINKISAKAIPVEDSGSIMTATNVEEVLVDILDGTETLVINTGSQITGFTDGTYDHIIPTNGMANAVVMMGNSSTIAWFYLNAAPPGWKVTTTGADTVLAVKATAKSSGTATTDTADKLIDTGADFVTDAIVVGDVAYNTEDGTSALVTAVDDLNTLSLASDAFPDGNETYEVGSRFIDPGGNQADEGTWDFTDVFSDFGDHIHQWYDYISTPGGVNLDTGVAYTAKSYDSSGDPITIGVNADMYTDQQASWTSGNSIWRPAASVGRLFQLDTA